MQLRNQIFLLFILAIFFWASWFGVVSLTNPKQGIFALFLFFVLLFLAVAVSIFVFALKLGYNQKTSLRRAVLSAFFVVLLLLLQGFKLLLFWNFLLVLAIIILLDLLAEIRSRR